jgi:hypothetical protein
MSHHHNAGQNHKIHIANKYFSTVVNLENLGMAVTNQNYIHE